LAFFKTALNMAVKNKWRGIVWPVGQNNKSFASWRFLDHDRPLQQRILMFLEDSAASIFRAS
jgi:hypothetical protein